MSKKFQRLREHSRKTPIYKQEIFLLLSSMYKSIYYIRIYITMENKPKVHYPRLDTVLMVEDAIRKAKEYPSKRQLWLALEKKVMYQTFSLIISYLEDSGKIVHHNGKIIWVWNPELVSKYSNSKLVLK